MKTRSNYMKDRKVISRISHSFLVTMNYQDPAWRKEAYLDYYAHNNSLASWSEVAEVLHWCELYQEADVVEKTYVQGMHLQSSLSHDIH